MCGLRIGPFRPAARNRVELVWELAHGSRNLDSERLEEVNVVALTANAGRRARHCLPLAPIPGYRRVGQPGDRDVVQDLVSRQPLRLSIAGPRDPLVTCDVMVAEARRASQFGNLVSSGLAL